MLCSCSVVPGSQEPGFAPVNCLRALRSHHSCTHALTTQTPNIQGDALQAAIRMAQCVGDGGGKARMGEKTPKADQDLGNPSLLSLLSSPAWPCQGSCGQLSLCAGWGSGRATRNVTRALEAPWPLRELSNKDTKRDKPSIFAFANQSLNLPLAHSFCPTGHFFLLYTPRLETTSFT